MPERPTHSRSCRTDAPSLDRGLAVLAEQAASCIPAGCGATATALLGPDLGGGSPGPGSPGLGLGLGSGFGSDSDPGPGSGPGLGLDPGSGLGSSSDPGLGSGSGPGPDSGPGPGLGPDPDSGPNPDPGLGEQLTAATHPDLSALVSVQLHSGEGPIPAARVTGRPAAADDLLHDRRWPGYRARALDAGVRSSATLPFVCEGLTVTVSVYGLRPGPLEEAARGATRLLGDLATESLARDVRYRAALTELGRLDEALRSRPVVDQACGIMMRVLGCDADAAFDLLRRASQRANRKLAELAETVVRTRGRGIERDLLRLVRPDRGRKATLVPARPEDGPC